MLSLLRTQFSARTFAVPAAPLARFSTSAAAFEAAKKAKKTTKAPAKKAAAKKAAPPKKESVKRFTLPFMFYVKEYYAKHGEELKSSAFGDRIKIIKRSWDSLSGSEKAPYVELYEKDLKRYEAAKAEAAQNAPPKRPTNSYLTWFNEERDSLSASNPGLSVTELSKIAGEKWRSFSEQEKGQYNEEYKANLEAWKAEYSKWKDARSL